MNVTKILFIIKNSITILFIEQNIECTESKIVFPNININKIAFNDYFLKMNKNERYKNIIRLSKCYTNSIDLKIVINK